MEVIKSRSEVGTYDISIKESETKSLALVWGGNGDLYWLLDNLEDIDVKDDPMYDSFNITKEKSLLFYKRDFFIELTILLLSISSLCFTF